MKKLAPIIFICYNRPIHTKKSIYFLKKNKFAKNSDLYIFSDAAKNKLDEKKVLEIRNFLKKIKGFKKIKIICRKKNYGTKKNILDAVNFVFKSHNKLIVIEDDIIVSNSFLSFMNFCLNYYENNKKIWHINGWSYPFMKNEKNSINFLRSMNCWGWATWSDRWKNLILSEIKLIKSFSPKKKHYFNIFSSMNHFSQILRNKKKTLTSWAVFWHATIFLKNGICIYPKYSLVKNIGFDGSGRMSSQYQYKSYLKDNFIKFKLNDKIIVSNKLRNEEFLYYFKKNSFIRKVIILIKKFFYTNF